MSKNYPASEYKLAELRKKGIFPRSNFLQRAFKYLTLVVLVFVVFPWAFSFEEFRFFFEELERYNFSRFFYLLTKLTLVSLFFLSISFLLGLLQTKFFFSSIKPNISRRKISYANIIYHLIAAAFALLPMFFGFYHNLKQYLIPSKSVNSNLEYKILTLKDFDVFKASLFKISLIYFGIFIIFGLVSYLINWLLFRKDQMMTREEVEAEFREQQAPQYSRGT